MQIEAWQIWILISGIVGGLAFVLVRGYVQTTALLALLFLAIFLHIFQIYGYVQALDKNPSSPLYAISSILGIILAVGLNWWIFDLKLNLVQFIGLIFGIVAIILMAWTS